jgi:ribosomal protein S18 acetylase RimI-like enzyme
MIPEIITLADAMEAKLISCRRDLHKYAESGWFEMRTSSLIARRLTELGYEVLVGSDVCLDEARMGVPDEEKLEAHYQKVLTQGADPEFVEATRDFFRHADQTTLLAMDGEVAVACATLCYKRCIPTLGHPTGRRAHIMNVYVAEGYRRQSLGKRLMLALHEEAASRGVTEITLDATDEGRKLYTTLGYQASDECMYLDIGHPPA